jgi:hypothetical protein
VLHAGAVRRGGSDEPLMPGDRVRFVARSSAPSYVAVLSLDAAGRAAVYYPDAARAAALPAGAEQAFASSVVLDDTIGPEHWYALFCREPIALAPLQASLQAQGKAWSAPAGCEVETVRVRKVRAQ